jgi:hypothetical protein
MKYFPEGPVVSAKCEGDTIRAIFENGYAADLHIPTFSELAVQISPGKPPNLLFHRGHASVFPLPMNSAVADHILAHVRQRPGFDEAALEEALARKAPARIPILRHAPPVNASLDLLEDKSENQALFDQDIDNGFRLVSSGEHIPWGITMEAALARFGGQPDGYKDSGLRFGPIRLGRLQINDVVGSSGVYRSDIPAGSWTAEIVLQQDGWKENELLLIAYFRRMLGEPQKVEFWANRGETVTTWERGKISVNVKYRSATLKDPEEGFCDFVIYNLRDYPEYLTDAYCMSVIPAQVCAKLFSVPKVKLSDQYALSPYVRATPPGLLELFSGSGNFLVWSDNDRTHVGFADRCFAAVYPRAVIGRLLLQNRQPERGEWPSSLLWVAYAGQESEHDPPNWCRSAGEADFGAFDGIFTEIAGLTGLTAQKLDDLDDR